MNGAQIKFRTTQIYIKCTILNPASKLSFIIGSQNVSNQIQISTDIHQFYDIERCFQSLIHNWGPKYVTDPKFTSMHVAGCRRPLMDLLGCVFPVLIASVKAFTRNNLYCLGWDEGIFLFPHPTPLTLEEIKWLSVGWWWYVPFHLWIYYTLIMAQAVVLYCPVHFCCELSYYLANYGGVESGSSSNKLRVVFSSLLWRIMMWLLVAN